MTEKKTTYAIWAAVSSKAQAEDDKYSLGEQETLCREVATGKGWHESAPSYVVPGKSRTRWINLSDAEQAIPQLKLMLDDAQAGKFNVLVVLEYDRFRDLLEPVANALSDCGVQIYSVSQPIEPQDPEEYNPYSSDSDFLMRGMNQIISKAAIASLRRKYQAQMPLRILNRGLPHNIPYGYRKPLSGDSKNARSAVPEQNPDIISHIVQMKDWLLAGHSMAQIAIDLDEIGAPRPGANWGKNPKKWSTSTVGNILRNPFYAGYVRWGRSHVKRNRRTGQVLRIMQKDAKKMIIARGRHVPIWDDATQEAILAEIGRRTPTFRGYITSHLSALLHCPLCGALLWRSIREECERYPRRIIWRCSIGGAKHFQVSDNDAMQGVAAYLRKVLEHEIEISLPGASQSEKLDDLKAQRKRIANGYQAGIFDMADAAERTAAIDEEIAKILNAEKTRETISAEATMRAEIITSIRAMGEELAQALAGMDPQEANRMLSMLFLSVTISGDGDVLSSVPRTS